MLVLQVRNRFLGIYFLNWYDVICGFKSRSEADGDEQVKYSYGVKSRASLV